MAKGNIINDTFEQLAELGVSTVKKTGQSVKQTFNPLQIFEAESDKQSPENKQKSQKELGTKNNHTPLDFDKLGGQYQTQEKQKEEALRQRLFQLVKGDEKRAVEERKQEKKQQEQAEIREVQEKNKRIEAQKQQSYMETPKGKERRSILSKKKKVTQEQAEFKPSTGKS